MGAGLGFPRWFGAMRVRKKLLFLHTCFSLTLAALLLLTLRAPIADLVTQAEIDKADTFLRMAMEEAAEGRANRTGAGPWRVSFEQGLVRVDFGDAAALGASPALALRLDEAPGTPMTLRRGPEGAARIVRVPGTGPAEYAVALAQTPGARAVVWRVYLLLIASLIVIYGLIVVALEVFVLPRNVYGPIGVLLQADAAVRARDHGAEIIPERAIPEDELGEIMRSRNATVEALRRQEGQLAEALDRLEHVAADLRRKNHLLENARRNLEGTDRLVSLGMMSAGIAHELNTPLAVAKGLVEKLDTSPDKSLAPAEAALLRRVIGRLERLSEGLLDFARARPAACRWVGLRDVVEEALTLVRLDRQPGGLAVVNDVDPSIALACDADRLVQVLVNLVRNAVDIMRESGVGTGVVVSARRETRDGDDWVSLRVVDDGPGIDPGLLPTLFDPFVSSRLDARGTGLGLAVAEGIVREHMGTLIARNRGDGRGAEFEALLPKGPGGGRAETGMLGGSEADHA